jgi:hypothetical protein
MTTPMRTHLLGCEVFSHGPLLRPVGTPPRVIFLRSFPSRLRSRAYPARKSETTPVCFPPNCDIHCPIGSDRSTWFPLFHCWRRKSFLGRIEPTGRSQAKVCQGPTRRPVYESAARLGHLLPDATPNFGVEPCEALLASPFRPRLGVSCGWRPFPKDSSHGQATQ